MTASIPHIDAVFRLLKKQMVEYESPIVSQKKQDIPDTPFVTFLIKYNTPEKVVKLSEQKIASLIYPVGFYKTKAKRIKEISQTLLDKYQGKVPDQFEELLTLKGVGKKTASIVMVYGHKIYDFIPVDVHVHVIANRLGWVKSKNPDETMEKLMKIVPKRYWYDLNNLFVSFGQNICKTISPWCSKCPTESYCPKIGVLRYR